MASMTLRIITVTALPISCPLMPTKLSHLGFFVLPLCLGFCSWAFIIDVNRFELEFGLLGAVLAFP